MERGGGELSHLQPGWGPVLCKKALMTLATWWGSFMCT